MTTAPQQPIAAAHVRDREAKLIEPAATALAEHTGSTCFDRDLPDSPRRAVLRDLYRAKAEAALQGAGVFQLDRDHRHLRYMDRMSTRHALAAERDVAEIGAKLAAREADIARLRAQLAARAVELHDATEGRPRAGDRMLNGDEMGTLVTCRECSGDGLLHQPDQPPTPGPAPQQAEPAPA